MKKGEIVKPLVGMLLVIVLAFLFLIVPLKSPTGLQTADQPPLSADAYYVVDGSFTVDLLQYFSGPEGQSLTFVVEDAAVVLDGSMLTFTPPVGFSGDYVVNIQVSDGVNTVYKPITFVVQPTSYVIQPTGQQPTADSQELRGQLQTTDQQTEESTALELTPSAPASEPTISDITISAVPTHDAPILNSTDGSGATGNNASTSENLTVFVINATDADGDAVQNITDWRLNGQSIAVLNMPFETNVTVTTAGAVRDYGMGANNGTLGGGTAASVPLWNAAGQVGGAYTFDGVNDFIETNAAAGNFTAASSFSVEAWVNSTLDNADRVVVGKVAGGDVGWHLRITIPNAARFILASSGGVNKGSDTAVLTAGYHHLVGTWDGATARTYLDGALSSSPFSSGVPGTITNTVTLKVGKDDSLPGYFRGTIDEVRVYNRSLSATQIRQLFLDGNGSRHPVTFVANETAVGDVWSVAVTPNDNQNASDGSTVLSNNVTILNADPSIAQV
ncbi:LamG domain-containing protein, partial [Candidatus Woesearchaeota archaeon]|nr:LamG domain-containing protein [Candidatus Woesearchaeota archaeon]